MKKVLFSLFFVLVSIFIFSAVTVKADGFTLTATNGASVRTQDPNGLKFEATVTGDVTGTSITYGFILSRGSFDKTTLLAKAANKKVEVDCGEPDGEGKYNVTITNIPEEGYTGNVTALAFVDVDGEKTYAADTVVRNLMDTARAAYNSSSTYDEGENLVKTIAEAYKVKVTHSNDSVNYYSTLAAAITATFADGDTVDLVKGTYSDALTISVDDFTLNGAGKNIAITTSGNRSDGRGETVLSNTISLSNGKGGLTINGLKFTGTNVINLNESQSNIVLKYNNCVYSGNYGIKDTAADYASATHTNITLANNYFKSSNATYNRDVYLQGFVKNLEVTDNYFGSTTTTLHDNGYGIKCNRISADSVINIKNNLFRNYNANYLIDLGYTANNKSYVNIENNEMSSSYTTCLVGNGIRVANLKTDGVVAIIHNIKFRTSPYFNAIMLSCGTTANDATSQYPFVDVRFNKFYVEECATADLTKPEGRNTVTSRYTRIGLGVPADLDDKLVLERNYFGSSTSGYAYTTTSSASAVKNTNTISLKNNEATSADADSEYSTYDTALDAFAADLGIYLDEMGTLGSSVNAYYGGTGDADITSYISSFIAAYADIYEIQAGKLIFVTDSVTTAGKLAVLAKNNVLEADSIKP